MPTFPRSLCLPVLLTALILPAAAEDSDQHRYYLQLRGQDTNPGSDVHDAWGVSLGMNFNRYLGVELAMDNFEIWPAPGGGPELGEYAVWSIAPQFRVRYPLMQDRLVPYAFVGAGYAFTQFNDRKPVAFGTDIQWESGTPLITLGGGLEYFFDDNAAIGLEFKYLMAEKQTLTVGGVRHDLSIDAPLLTLGLRLNYPELKPRVLADAEEHPPTRIYFGARVGATRMASGKAFDGVYNRAEPPAYFGVFDQLFGFMVGLNWGEHWGVELSGEVYETHLFEPALGVLGEYATYPVIPMIRYREPLGSGKIVPYALAGVGFAHHEFNDRKGGGLGHAIDEKALGWAAAFGGGCEYYVTRNVSFFGEIRYVFSRGQKLNIDGGAFRSGNADAFLGSAGLRVYLGEWNRHHAAL